MPRRSRPLRAAAIALVTLPLVALAVASPAFAATTPTLSNPTIVVDYDGILTISGTGVPGETIATTINGTTFCGSTVVLPNTTWFCSINPASATVPGPGVFTFSATANDGTLDSPPATGQVTVRYPPPTNLHYGYSETENGFSLTVDAYNDPGSTISAFVAGEGPLTGTPVCSNPIGSGGTTDCFFTRDDAFDTSVSYDVYQYPPGSGSADMISPAAGIAVPSNPYWIAPPSPVITSPANGSSVSAQPLVVSGTGGLASDSDSDHTITITVFAVVGGEFDDLCAVTVTNTTWSCTLGTSLALGAHEIRATQSNPTESTTPGESVTFTLVAPPPPPAVPPPLVVRPPVTETPAPTYNPTFTWGDSSELSPGDELDITGADAPPGATAVAEIHSTPIALGRTTVAQDGTFSLHVTVPEGVEPGEHNLVLLITQADGTASSYEQPVTVLAPPAVEDEPEIQSSDDGAAAPLAEYRSFPGAETSLAADSLVRPEEVLSSPLVLTAAGFLGLALVLLVAVPAEFFGEAVAAQYAAFTGAIGRRGTLARAVAHVKAFLENQRVLAGVILIVATSLVFGFVDPGFGIDLASLRLLLSCALSILLVNHVSALITELIAKRRWGVESRLEVMPWGLAIAVVGVIASRILDFSPGFLIGSIIGLGILGAPTATLVVRVLLLRGAIMWLTAIAAWLLIGAVPVLGADDPAAFWTSLLSDTLVATSAAGLTALLVAMLPIDLLDGGEIFAYSKRLWAIAFGITAVSFSIVIVPSAANWLNLGDRLEIWILLTGIFIVLAIVAYAFARRRNRAKAAGVEKELVEA